MTKPQRALYTQRRRQSQKRATPPRPKSTKLANQSRVVAPSTWRVERERLTAKGQQNPRCSGEFPWGEIYFRRHTKASVEPLSSAPIWVEASQSLLEVDRASKAAA